MSASPSTKPAARPEEGRVLKDFWVDQYGRRWRLKVKETPSGLAITEAAPVDGTMVMGSEFFRLLNITHQSLLLGFYPATAGVQELAQED